MRIIQRCLLLFLILGNIGLCACSRQALSISENDENKTIVTIGYLPITHALAIFEEKELLETENHTIQIHLQKFSSWADLMDALNSGRIDGASVLMELAMNAKSKGIDLKAMALGHTDGNVIVVSDKIQSPTDLKGKTLAIPSMQSSHNILLRDALNKAGLRISDINLVQLSPTEMPSALVSKAIDGYCVAEPFGAQAVALGFGHILYRSEELWSDSLCCGLVLRSDTIRRLGDDNVELFMQKYHAAGKQLQPEEASRIAEKYLGQDTAILALSLQWISFDDLTISKQAYTLLAEKMMAYGIHSNPPAYEDFVYKPK